MRRIALTSLALLAPILAAVPVVGPASAAGETCDGRVATMVVKVGADPDRTQAVTGTAGDDVTGGEGDDRLFGGLDGREQTVTPMSGEGVVRELISPRVGNAWIRRELARRDPILDPTGTDTVGDQVSPGPGEDVLLADFADFAGKGNAKAENRGHISPDTVDGGDGRDVIFASWGPLDVVAGNGSDAVVIPNGKNNSGTADGSRIVGGAGNDFIFAMGIRHLPVQAGSGSEGHHHSRPAAITPPDRGHGQPQGGPDEGIRALPLHLGRGVDEAYGSRGRDTCINAERAQSCEIRRR